MDQDQQANPGTYDGHQELGLMMEQRTLGTSTLALYRQIQPDPAFAANYRETVYTTTHAIDSLVDWSNLRYIERR